MYRNNVENNENYGHLLGMKQCRRDKYLEDTSMTKEDDEISRSLQMFAMLTAYKPEPSQSHNQVDAIMQEFASNGYSCDERKYHQNNSNEHSYPDISVKGSFYKILPSHAAEYPKKTQHRRYHSVVKCEKITHCVFCENNRESDDVVRSHAVRDSFGRVLCPKLRTYVCPICGASGDNAHTIKYCPHKPIITMEDAIRAESLRLAAKNAFFKQHVKT